MWSIDRLKDRCTDGFAGFRPIEGTIHLLDACRNILMELQLSPTSHFSNDLGLDSLDTVEVVMAIEEVCTGMFRDATSGGTDELAGVQH